MGTYTGRITPLSSAITLALAASTLSSAAIAQNRELEEVIVTAQKREQSLQDVPVAVTAIGTEGLEALAINEMTDLTRASASLTFGRGGNKQNSGFRIRGIGTTVFSIGVEASVAVIIDEVSQIQPGQALTNLIDIERVEVLRGPQSTLFGKNASAGLINVTTKSPSEEFEGYAELTVTEDDEQKIVGSVSGPISDSMGYRLTGYYQDFDGYTKNVALGTDISGSKSKGVRGKLSWDVTDNFDLTLTAYYSEDDDNCCALTHRELDSNARFFGAIPVTLTNPKTLDMLSDSNSSAEIDVEPDAETEDTGFNLKANWSIGEHVLTSLTAFNNWQYNDIGDVDWSAYDVAGVFTGGALSGGIVSHSATETDFFSQELRLSSPASDTLEYLVGLYYADAETDRSFDRSPVLFADWDATAKTESFAVFGQLTWKFTDQTHLTLGGRYNDEEISVEFDDNLAAENYPGNDSEDVWLGKISLQHFLNDNTMLYASAATGHKGQAYDISTGFDQFKADNPVGAESSDSFEIGVKTTLLERRLQLNAVAFYTQYDDYQAQNTELNGTELVLAISNVGSLESSGIELDALALIGDNFTLSASVAYIDATVEEYPGANCYSGQTEEQGCVEFVPGTGVFLQDLSGADLNNSPDWKINLGGQYVLPLISMPFDGFLNFSYSWQDEVNYDLAQNPKTVQDSYGIFNMAIGLNERDSDRYRLTLFVNNLFDDDYAAAIADLSGLYGGANAIIHLIPRNAERYAGIRLKVAF